MSTLTRRVTPWDKKGKRLLLPEVQAREPVEKDEVAPAFFVLEGRYLYDPKRVTTGEVRSFLWAGLRVLRSEAERRGLPKEMIDQLVMTGFETFDDVADRVWDAMRRVVTAPPGGASNPPLPGAAAAPAGESPEQAELRRLSLLREAEAAYNRAELDRELRDLLDLDQE